MLSSVGLLTQEVGDHGGEHDGEQEQHQGHTPPGALLLECLGDSVAGTEPGIVTEVILDRGVRGQLRQQCGVRVESNVLSATFGKRHMPHAQLNSLIHPSPLPRHPVQVVVGRRSKRWDFGRKFQM